MVTTPTTSLDIVILSVIVGTLAAIVYSLRVLVLMERRIARVDINIEKIAKKIVEEEVRIEHVEDRILREEGAIERKIGVGKKRRR